jgi:hypothetical protein
VLQYPSVIRDPQYKANGTKSQVSLWSRSRSRGDAQTAQQVPPRWAVPFAPPQPYRPPPKSLRFFRGAGCSVTGTLFRAALSRARLSKSPPPAHCAPAALPPAADLRMTAAAHAPAALPRARNGGRAYAPGQGTPPPGKSGVSSVTERTPCGDSHPRPPEESERLLSGRPGAHLCTAAACTAARPGRQRETKRRPAREIKRAGLNGRTGSVVRKDSTP